MKPWLAVVVVSLAIAPIGVAQTQWVASDARAGEAVNGFPNWEERVLHEWINRARVDPGVEMQKCGSACLEAACYAPVAPLGWGEALNHSARYHAVEMMKQNYFDHDSKCTVASNIGQLYPAGCDGSASCGCVGGSVKCGPNGCTSWSSRVGMFGASPFGEVISSAKDPNISFYLWLYEGSLSASCGFTTFNAHRYIIFTAGGSVGLGVSDYSVGDFGSGDAPYRIPSGSHYPKQAQSVELWANWYDSKAPKSATAVVDGNCLTMSLKRGSQTNGAWTATANNVATGCHRYYFSFVDSTGATVTYPATGSLAIGNGPSCADWDTSRINSTCGNPVTPPPSTKPSRRRSVRH
jgi:hypothetical protein